MSDSLIPSSLEISFLNSLQNVSMTRSESRKVIFRVLSLIPVLLIVIVIKLLIVGV